MGTTRFSFAAAICLAIAGIAYAQSEPAPAPPPPSSPQNPSTLSDAASGSYERRTDLPSVNIYLPEGQASIRLRKLIRNVLFESQIDYKFVNGDISTFLRYKYYARNYTYRLGVFDSIQFPDIGSSNNKGFDRVRGGLLLFGMPKDYNNRYFLLLQDDALTFGDADNPDNRKNNLYTKIGYQYGTPFDERMNSIVGETRGRITPVLTAFRDIGPQRNGLAAAITQSGRVLNADYQYTRLEVEGIRRTDLTSTSFIFTRLHAGAFLARGDAERDVNGDGVIDDPSTLPLIERYSIPRYELFRLGGRDALKSISSDDEAVGTQEIHLTNELFVPIFRNRNYRTWALHWSTLYGIAYAGAGTVGFNWNEIAKAGHNAFDAGLGAEAALTVRDYDVYLSVLIAHAIEGPGDAGGTKVRFSIHTVH